MGKSLEITIHVYCRIPPQKNRKFNDPFKQEVEDHGTNY